MLYLDNDNSRELQLLCYRLWPEKKVQFYSERRSWYTSRYFILTAPVPKSDLCYQYYMGFVELDIDNYYDNEDLVRELHKELVNNDRFHWHAGYNRKQGNYRFETELDTVEEVIDGFKQIIGIVDPIIKRFLKIESSPVPMDNNIVKTDIDFETQPEKDELIPEIKSISELPWSSFDIPTYQRPYKWAAKNVNQLISDINFFKDSSAYRLGTLVLHKHNSKLDIVDGQQRIITLALLLSFLFEKFKDTQLVTSHTALRDSIKSFCDNIKFTNRHSLHNVVENMNTIATRTEDLTEVFFDFLLRKCEFVTVSLNKISEAFQFFDSQNARGKDLEGHDLLKAFHLREMDPNRMTEQDSDNINQWQNEETKELRDIFLTLFRAKYWSLGKSARYFTKNDTHVFKGVSLKEKNRYPFYQMEIIAHIYIEYYLKSPDRIVDGSKMEYPYNLDDQIVNGSRFFDMIRHYSSLTKQMEDPNTYRGCPKAEKVIDLIRNGYDGSYRTGDSYVQSMFKTVLLYYVDRFGFAELNKVVPKLFLWAFTCRLRNTAVQLASIDGYASQNSSILRVIHNAHTPDDILNVVLDTINESEIRCSKCGEVINIFKEYKKVVKQ